jgi:hypothetical protein
MPQVFGNCLKIKIILLPVYMQLNANEDVVFAYLHG